MGMPGSGWITGGGSWVWAADMDEKLAYMFLEKDALQPKIWMLSCSLPQDMVEAGEGQKETRMIGRAADQLFMPQNKPIKNLLTDRNKAEKEMKPFENRREKKALLPILDKVSTL